MEGALEQESEQSVEIEQGSIFHYWVCSNPFFETTLFLVPAADCPHSDLSNGASVSLFDPDGDAVNELEVQFPAGTVGVVELNSLFGSSKLEGGFKHGHMVVRAAKGVKPLCRLNTRNQAAVLGEPRQLSAGRSSFFPLLFAESRSSFLALVNCGTEETTIKCRLFCGKRIPETDCLIPGLGARIISIEDEFPDYAVAEEDKKIQAYVRLGSKSAQPVGVLLFEQTKMLQEDDFYCSVS